MKSPCKNCAQKEVGCFEECADCRAYRAEHKKRRIFGRRREAAQTEKAELSELLLFPNEQLGAVTINDLEESARRLALVPLTIRR